MNAGSNIHITAGGHTALHFAAGSPNIGAKQCLKVLLEGWAFFTREE
jgi:hypothetical protein